MCGITGIYAFNEAGRFNLINLQKSIDQLEHRGPDAQGSFFDEKVGLGHRRLAVIDTSAEANQPFTDASGRYMIIFNGEIYNYKQLKTELESLYGVRFRTNSDTEALLYSFIYFGEKCLEKLNGFFAFAVYDKKKRSVFIARDRFGIKPLYYFQDDFKFLFASELRSILAYGIEKSLNYSALSLYFQLNYIPAPYSIVNSVYKLMPGHLMILEKNEVIIKQYFSVSTENEDPGQSFENQKKMLSEKLEESVRQRLVADVPLGVFLSGGIDSSLITAMASKHKEELDTFSVGYPEERYFDETRYAREVSDYFGTNHHVFSINNRELYDHLFEILDHIDEPFADSSAIPVYLLSKFTREHVTVALSGDGADEVFSGYNKHRAFLRSTEKSLFNSLILASHFLMSIFPKSRNNFISDKFRQLERYSLGLRYGPAERYWFWASLMTMDKANNLISREGIDRHELLEFQYKVTSGIKDPLNFNTILKTDLDFILPNDMLYKVDLMSMAHGLEVRVPFLDHQLVNYAFTLPAGSKINKHSRKRILREILHELIPGKLYKRPKQGFEVPLTGWFRNELRSIIENDLLQKDFIREQGIFNSHEVELMKKKLYSPNPGDAPAHTWAMIVFQWWWRKHFT